MFTLKSPDAIRSISGMDDHAHIGVTQPDISYPSLDAAIQAALGAGIDLDESVIEKQAGAQASVNDWIAVRIAGGDLRAG